MQDHGAWNRLDALTLHAAYRSGALGPEQLIDELYARMEREATPGLWIARVPREQALAQARALGRFQEDPARPLFGLPFAVKDNIDVAGLATTAACPAFGYVPRASAPAVTSLLRAGAICLGKLNMDQFATGLVGTRSPYGACRNAFDPAYVAGGSSSGSALAVAQHYATFTLGTDTAGSGRVPAALNNVVGLKPSRGLLSNTGMVPACASLDCLSVFAACVEDAALVREVISGERRPSPPWPVHFRFGAPKELEFFGDGQSRAAFERALARLEALGGEPHTIDWGPFAELGEMLYGPFVVERYLGLGDFIAAQPDAVLPVIREIVLGARRFSASDAFRAFQRVGALRAACVRELERVDYLATPTVPTHCTLEADSAEPRAVNDKLGIYTRFVNFVGGPVLAVPQDFRADGLPFGISLANLPGNDRLLDQLGAALHRASDAGMGRLRHALAPLAPEAPRRAPQEARLAVVGAHMRGLALNPQLIECGARYVATCRTAPNYRLFALPNTQPERPGLVQLPARGVAIEIELWDLPWRGLGALMARVPPPLAIGTLETEDRERVKGFLCESYAVEGARDISEFGGYRRYCERSGDP